MHSLQTIHGMCGACCLITSRCQAVINKTTNMAPTPSYDQHRENKGEIQKPPEHMEITAVAFYVCVAVVYLLHVLRCPWVAVFLPLAFLVAPTCPMVVVNFCKCLFISPAEVFLSFRNSTPGLDVYFSRAAACHRSYTPGNTNELRCMPGNAAELRSGPASSGLRCADRRTDDDGRMRLPFLPRATQLLAHHTQFFLPHQTVVVNST